MPAVAAEAYGPMSVRQQNFILQALRQQGTCSITDLAAHLSVSTETVRRNVQPLIATGALVRFHGGVSLSESQAVEPPFQRRLKVNASAKKAVARIVRVMVEDGDSLILDNGTSAVYVADALEQHSRLVVVTNSAEIAHRLATRNGNRVFMAGGELNSEDAAAFGSSTVEFVKQFEVKFAFLSVAGIRESGDLAVFHLFEAEFARAAMRQAKQVWILADHSKFGREAPVRVSEIAAVDGIISDEVPSPRLAAKAKAVGARLLCGEPDVVTWREWQAEGVPREAQ